ncbi:MAG: benzoyl-CoA reductase subunit A [Polyangiaceae bacterium]|nr:benzoyl-CoA reductase subunit A [Polyangiaceae bacterium]
MKCVVGIDLGSTTTKAVLLDEAGSIIGRGITNSRSNYETACAVARLETLSSARFYMLERALEARAHAAPEARSLVGSMRDAYRLELFLGELGDLRATILRNLGKSLFVGPAEPDFAATKKKTVDRATLEHAASRILDAVERGAPATFLGGAPRKSEFFRDLAGAAYVAEAEALAKEENLPFEPLAALYDRAILEVEGRLQPRDTGGLLERALVRVRPGTGAGPDPVQAVLAAAVAEAATGELEEIAVVGTGYGRQTLPFPKESVRSEILCHGRGAHRVFDGTRTVLDIGGQDTKAIQVDGHGVVTSFQMNDRCAAGCGRYLGYIADELNLGLHELGPLALKATKSVRVCSTCTVFAGAELRERLALGQKREDILAGLHRAIMLRAMSLLARSGGIKDEFTFTGGVCNNPMATKVLRELVNENYSADITLNIHPDSIYMGALGAALYALDDARADRPPPLPPFVKKSSHVARA